DANTTTTSIFPFTTLAVPDTTPPVITSGPSVQAVTATQITVVWTTDEPATSGVSYNDGSHYGVTSDTGLTTTHQSTISGLTPSTQYSISVSSTDASGNGPTVSNPVTATTNAMPDTTPPVISNIQVSNVTTSSATIAWTTDERSDSAVSYGTKSKAP